MHWYLLVFAATIAAWITYEIHQAPYIEDENTTFENNDEDKSWDDDYHPDQPI